MGLTLEQYNQALIDASWVTVSLDGLLDRDNNEDGTAPTELPADPNEEDFTERLESASSSMLSPPPSRPSPSASGSSSASTTATK